MTVEFFSPSFRAASSDLTVAISPLGLVELSDEEFEVHGPRLNRYALNWAFYLGHHYGYRREIGEPQLAFNYCRAFSDYISNFCFGGGLQFRTPHMTEHIVPSLLKRVWEQDNPKEQTLWEIAQQGSVSGDVFVKIAWEPAAPPQVPEGRVRILPINSAYCFPEWHPHDRTRLLRFKMKYRFWGTTPEGTRSVFTYTELLTDDAIEEYINDELIDSRENPLGQIPIVHIANAPASGSPWGLSDIQDIIPLNREYNEKATDISDIINYHAAPVTIITGAKASNLEKGPKKVWGGLPKDANVFNLENGVELTGPMNFLELLKRAMHEMTGVPEQALGQFQPISNTSGVALAIQFQPLMNRYKLKQTQYSAGLEKINFFILQTLALFDPQRFIYDPSTEGLIEDDQAPVLNIQDPNTYLTTIHWPSPLPVDNLVKLNEIQVRMGLGIESKRGALRALGEEFPDEKMQEVFHELVQDSKEQGALDMLRANISAAILQATGMAPTVPGQPQPPGGGAPQDGDENSDGSKDPGTPPPPAPMLNQVSQLAMQGSEQMLSELVTQAYGTKLPQRRVPDDTD